MNGIKVTLIYNISEEKAEVIRIDLIRKCPYPIFKGENFSTKAVWWNVMSQVDYKIRWTNEINYICNYLENELTKIMIEYCKKLGRDLLLL